MTGGLSSVSISVTSAVVYFVSGTIFFSLIFLLVMLGVTDCDWDCARSDSGSSCCVHVMCILCSYHIHDMFMTDCDCVFHQKTLSNRDSFPRMYLIKS